MNEQPEAGPGEPAKRKRQKRITKAELAWWVAALELDRYVDRSNVHADEAALLLAGHDPTRVSLDDACDTDTPAVSGADVKRLRTELDGQPPRPLAAWLALARKAKLVVHPIVAKVIKDAAAFTVQSSAGGAPKEL